MKTAFAILFTGLLAGCASAPIEEPAVTEIPLLGDPGQQKTIFVFLDGTRNDDRSRTNVRQAYEAILRDQHRQTIGLYIEGVGSAETPVLGSVLGLGMQPRILRGYDFIAQHYQPGDRIIILGFSRGAHQARALAGLLSYAGVPVNIPPETPERRTIETRIIDIVKAKNDLDYQAQWKNWHPGQTPLLAADIQASLGLPMRSVEVSFLGLWDTVPGSWFKDFDDCKELPDRTAGDRYKSDSYPPIRQIAHAVALDEKRSRFQPLLICPALAPAYTRIEQRWFPGAHADVGGGYDDNQELSGRPYNWVMAQLATAYQSARPLPPLPENPLGRAHWSMGDRPANAFSHCEDRIVPDPRETDESFGQREKEAKVPVRIQGQVMELKYPQTCASLGEKGGA